MCVCVYMYVCVYVCEHVHTYIFVSICITLEVRGQTAEVGSLLPFCESQVLTLGR